MNRRSFLIKLGAFGASAAWIIPVYSDSSGMTSITVDPNGPVVPISPTFLGFSYESALMSPGGFLAVQNTSLLKLYSLLGQDGVVRIGGNTSEFMLWRKNEDKTPEFQRHVLTANNISRVAEFVHTVGWQCIYGLNLGTNDPSESADEAATVASAFGDALIAFQIGNEPDEFYKNNIRAPDYGVNDYLIEWRSFYDAVRKRVQTAKFAGPDVAGSISYIAEMAKDDSSVLSFLSSHYYAEGPASDPAVSIDRLIRSQARLTSTLTKIEAAAEQAQLPWRMTEVNSVYRGGKHGISDTFAAALWGVDMMMQIASAGGLGVNIHGGSQGAYSPVTVVDGVDQATAIFYAMLFFAQIGQGSIVSATIANPPARFSAYAVKDTNGGLKLIAINMSAVNDVTTTVDPGAQYKLGSVLRLTAPSLASVSGITLGQNGIAPDNSWTQATKEQTSFTGQSFQLTVPAASACLVNLT